MPHNDAILRDRKNSSSTFATMPSSQITMFKITTSAGNAIDQPLRPGDRFSGVLVVQLSRPIPASQVVLEMSATERWETSLKDNTRPEKTQIFSTGLVLWKAMRKGVNSSSVLSDGLHVFNFVCHIPNLNYPQNVRQPEFEILYQLEARLLAPRDFGGEQVVGTVTKDLFFTPLVVLAPNSEPLIAAETLYFEKKGKRSKPAVEVSASVSSRQLIPGSKVKIDMTIKELTSSSWTRVLVKLYERTRCRISTQMPFSQPLWSVDRELVQTEMVRSSVYAFFISNQEMANKNSSETKSSKGETISKESVIFHIPPVSCGALNTEHLEFSHFIRVEVVLPGWLSSDRSVSMDLPVQLMTCELQTAARFLSRRGSVPSIERKTESDSSSVVSGRSGSSAQRSTLTDKPSIMSAETMATVLQMLPTRYCDVPMEQRPTPSLMFVKQLNLNQAPNTTTSPQEVQQDPAAAATPAYYAAQQNRNVRNPTMTSMHSAGGRSSSSNGSTVDEYDKEKYRSRPLPMAPGMGAPSNEMTPPPLPAEPMPSVLPMDTRPTSSKTQITGGHQNGYPLMNIDMPPQNMHGNNPLVLSPYAPGDSIPADMSAMRCESPVGGTTAVAPEESYMLAGSMFRQQPSGPLHTPITLPYGGGHMSNGVDDDDTRYYKDSTIRSIDRDAINDGGMYRVRKNSSLKHYR
ncbi:hypothetical protein H4S08_003823 [Coemansia sp. RSA 1365]|nr:hypothetical protein H4S08_003823 [Coemansia sp. RSA 1365]